MQNISKQIVKVGAVDIRIAWAQPFAEAHSGMDFILKVANEIYDQPEMDLWKDDLGKPHFKIDHVEYGVSVAHSKSMIVAAFSKSRFLGIDLEDLQRTVSDKLRQRISYHSELYSSENPFTTLELWACKEAVLKAKGTGLRYAMRKLRVEKKGDETMVFTDDGQVYELAFCHLNKAYLSCVAIGQV